MTNENGKSRFFKSAEGEKEKPEEKSEGELDQEPEKGVEIERFEPEFEERSKLEKEIYQLEGVLKTLDRKFENDEIEEDRYTKKVENMRNQLANLYEKRIKRKL